VKNSGWPLRMKTNYVKSIWIVSKMRTKCDNEPLNNYGTKGNRNMTFATGEDLPKKQKPRSADDKKRRK